MACWWEGRDGVPLASLPCVWEGRTVLGEGSLWHELLDGKVWFRLGASGREELSREILLEPRFEGERFRHQTLPFALLRDLEALQGIILEIAKSDYRQANPDRQRIPRGFCDQLELHLSTRGGSFVAEVALITEDDLLEGCDPRMQRARAACDQFLETLAHVQEQRQGSPPPLPDTAWSYVERFGRGLLPDESIRMVHGSQGEVRLTRDLRRRVLLSRPGSKPLTEEVRLPARVVQVQPKEKVMPVQLVDGRVITCAINDRQVADLQDVRVGDFGVRWVLISGIGLFDASQQLLRIEEANSVDLLDSQDPIVQIEQLRNLADGWLDGKGIAPTDELLDALRDWLEHHLRGELLQPRLYPTPEGGVEAEWLIGRVDLSIEFDPASNTVEWHALDLEHDTVDERTFSLNNPEALQTLGRQLESTLSDSGDSTAPDHQEGKA